jgi:PKD repeat protein
VGASITRRIWDFGDGTTASHIDLRNFMKTYTTPGTYNVTLKVMQGSADSSGYDILTRTSYITVYSAANFMANPTTGTAPLAVSFTDTSTIAGISAWQWDFNNDGIIDSTSRNPSYIYSSPGTYTVKLTVTGTGGSYSQIKNNFITVTDIHNTNSGTQCGVFRTSNGNWYLDTTKTGVVNTMFHFGTTGDIPVTGDWDGNGIIDIGVYRPGSGNWYLDTTKTGVVNTMFHFGTTGDIPVTGDWDGNGITDICVFRPGSGNWYLDTTKTGVVSTSFHFGTSGDSPLVGKLI